MKAARLLLHPPHPRVGFGVLLVNHEERSKAFGIWHLAATVIFEPPSSHRGGRPSCAATSANQMGASLPGATLLQLPRKEPSASGAPGAVSAPGATI